MATSNITSFSTGLRTSLGPAASDLKTQVTQEAVTALLEAAQNHAGYQAHAERYEFRLRSLNGQAVLELKEKNWASKLKNVFGYARRSQERQAAREAIGQAFNLPSPPGPLNQRVTGQSARAFATEARVKNEARLDIIQSWHSAQKAFDVVIPSEDGQPAIPIALPKVFANDFILRLPSTLQDGKLLCSFEGHQPNNYAGRQARLQATENFIDLTLAGISDSDGRVRDNIKRNLLSFVMQGNADLHLKIMSAQLAPQSVAAIDPGDQTFDFELSIHDGQVVIDQRWESREGLGMRTDVRMAVPDLPLPEYKSRIVFSLPITELIRDDFTPESVQVQSAQWGFTGPLTVTQTA